MVSINTNLTDMIILESLNNSTNGINKSIERLTTGYKINHAKDNAANLSIVTNLSTKISSLLRVRNNTEDGISLLSTAQGGLEEISNLLKRLRNLSVQAMNGTYGEQSLEAMQAEADEIIAQINYIRENTEFNGMKLFYTPQENAVATTGVNRLNNAVVKVNGQVLTKTSSTEKISNNTFTQSIPAAWEEEPSVQLFSSNKPAAPAKQTSTSQKAGDITGAEDFNRLETRTIEIDGIQYKVTNRLSTSQSLSYTKDSSTGELIFYGSSFTIEGQNDVHHNLIIEGSYNYIYTGNLDDTVKILSDTSYTNTVYAQDGNDTLYSESVSVQYLYGGDGNDNISTGTNKGYIYSYGEAGDDTIYHHANGTAYGGDGNDNISGGNAVTMYGQNGDDIFNVYGSNCKVFGGGGTNTVAVDNGTNTLKIDVNGANATMISFAAKETKDVEICGIKYSITNTNTSAGSFYYRTTSPSSWEVLNGTTAYFKIVGDKNRAHNVTIKSAYTEFHGGDLNDTITMYAAYSVAYGGKGNDTFDPGAYGYNRMYGEDGDDTFTTKGPLNYISGGSGNDIIEGTNNYLCVINAGDGDDSITLSGSGFHNTVFGGAGNNTITGADKAVLLNGFGSAYDNAEVVEFDPSETKVINIGGTDYTIENTMEHANTLLYAYSPVSGQISFGTHDFSITGDKTKAHNIQIYGYRNNWYFGDLDDTVINYGMANYIYTYGGNDSLTLESQASGTGHMGEGDDRVVINNIGGTVSILGEGGDDTFEINDASTTTSINGGSGNDTYSLNNGTPRITDNGGDNIYNINTDSASISGASGNDTFYINGNNNTVLGGGGDDYFVIDGEGNTVDGGTGGNLYIDNSSGTSSIMNAVTDPNSGALSFTSQGETKTFSLNGKTYTVTNNFGGNNVLQYSLNPNTGVITVTGDNFKIDAEENEAAILNIRGNNNTFNGSNLNDKIIIEQGSNNIVNGNAGSDTLIMQAENNSLNGGAGNDSITLNASTNQTVDLGDGNDTILINSGNNTNINLGEGNNKVTVNGEGNVITGSSGNNTVTINDNDNELRLGDGDNKISVIGVNNSVVAGSGNNIIGIDGDNNIISSLNAAGTVNIIGDGNNITINSGDHSLNLKGDNNKYTTVSGSKEIEVEGNTNTITTGDGDDIFDIYGNNNTISTTGGTNETEIEGTDNTYQGGSGVDKVTLRGDSNTALGGDSNDEFMISEGSNNTIDGEAGDRNTVINNGSSTVFTNAVDITPRPFELRLKIDLGTGASSFLNMSISFNLFDFKVDFLTERGRESNIEKIDDLIKTVDEQLINIGSTINRLESILESHAIQLENLTSTRSTLRDADVAEESSNFIRYQILQEASATLASTTRNVNMEFLLGMINNLNR